MVKRNARARGKVSRFWLGLLMAGLLFSISAKKSQEELNKVIGIEVQQSGEWFQVVVTTTSSGYYYSIYPQMDPALIILDIADYQVSEELPAQLVINNGVINTIKTSTVPGEKTSVARIEIGLDQKMAQEVTRNENLLIITLKPEEKPKELTSEDLLSTSEGGVIVEEKTAEPVEVEFPPTPVSGATIGQVPVSKIASKLLDIVVSEGTDRTRILLVMDGNPPDFNSFEMKSPARLVLDLWKVVSIYPGNQLMVNSQGIAKLRIGQHPTKLRIVLDGSSASLPSYNIAREGERLVITVSKVVDVSTPAPPALAVPVVEPVSGETIPIVTPPPTPAVGPELIKVLGIDFKYSPQVSTIEVKTSKLVQYEKRENPADLVFSILLKGASIPPELVRSLDTTEFMSPVNLVSGLQVTPENVNIVVNLNKWVAPEIRQEGNLIQLNFPNVEAITEPVPLAPTPVLSGTEEILAPPPPAPVPTFPGPAPTPVPQVSAQPVRVQTIMGEKVYTGKSITIDAKNLEILDALRAIAEVSGLNIITSDDVKGKITLKLVNVPWDQALDLILQTKSLGMIKVGNVIRIASIKDIQKEQEELLKSKQQTEKLVELQTVIKPINYAKARDIATQLKNLTSERGKVDVDTRTNTLIIKDIPERIQDMERLIKALDTQTAQVLIEARIVEASVGITRQLGIQWGFRYNAGPPWGTPTGVTFPNTVQVGGAVLGGLINPVATGTLNAAGAQGGAVGISLGSLTGSASLDLLLKSLETQNKAKIISSPRIMTMDNQSATITQGVSIPYPPALNLSTGAAGGGGWQFVDASLRLEVTPHITADGSIIMEVTASNNEPNLRVVSGGSPSIDKKEAQTKIIVKDGETIVIGGIYKTKEGETINRTPFFSKLPLIGKLFQDKFMEDSRNELLIFLTPRIIKG